MNELYDKAVLKMVTQEVEILRLQEGDILLLKLGGDLGDGMPPWVPTPEDIEHHQLMWERVLSGRVKVIATHAFVEPLVIRQEELENGISE